MCIVPRYELLQLRSLIKHFPSSLPSSHSEVRDGIVVGLEDLGVVEDLVSECVESVQGHPDVGCSHPVLQETQQRCGGSEIAGISINKEPDR